MPKSKTLLLLTLIALLLGNTNPARSMPLSHAAQSLTHWEQVNDSAFNLGSGPDNSYGGEEAKELVVYNDQLYLGMEADNSLGARLWRTREGIITPTSQADWEEVAADSNGKPFGNSNLVQNDHIDSLAAFGNYLYVSTGNRGNGGQDPDGALLYRSQTGDSGSWDSPVAAAGFGDTDNENFKDMIVYHNWLCGGTWNQVTGAQVWCSQDGVTWLQKNLGGFGASANDPTNMIMVHSFVFNDQLYMGLENSGADGVRSADDIARVYRTANIDVINPTWEEVYSGEAGSINADLLGELNGYLYIATTSAQGIKILRSISGDASSWEQVNTSGMNGDPGNTITYNDSSVAFDGFLFVAVNNADRGFTVWRTAGILQDSNNLIGWEQFGPYGWSDPDNVHAGLTEFNDFLYAWTTNYASGQQVRRATSTTIFHTYLPHIEKNAN